MGVTRGKPRVRDVEIHRRAVRHTEVHRTADTLRRLCAVPEAEGTVLSPLRMSVTASNWLQCIIVERKMWPMRGSPLCLGWLRALSHNDA